MGTCVECSSPTSRQCRCLVPWWSGSTAGAGVVTWCRCLGAWYCSPRCQTLAWPAHRSSCPATEVAALPGKGRALAASRTIARGATILREAAIMLVDCGQGRRPAQAITDQVREGGGVTTLPSTQPSPRSRGRPSTPCRAAAARGWPGSSTGIACRWGSRRGGRASTRGSLW